MMKANASDIRNRPAYGPAEAARYLRLPAATLRTWLVGRAYPKGDAQATFHPASITGPDSSEARSRTPRLHADAAVSRTVIGSDSERQQLVSALARCNGNKAEAARLLGIPRSTFFSKLRRHGLG